MTLDDLIGPWSGAACRHIPDGSPYSVLDTRFAARSQTNRWNRPGEPTLYFASDHAVLIGEFARHLRDERNPSLGPLMPPRRMYDLQLRLDAVLDLRDPAVCAALSLSDAPSCFLDRDVARATAGFIRTTTRAQALLTHSMAFLDAPDHWVMALFLERLDAGSDAVVSRVEPDGIFRYDPSSRTE
jgi:RES domain-containing protein